VRAIPYDGSVAVATAWSSGFQKLGQPVWLSNLVSDENSARSQPAHANVPWRCSAFSGLLYGGSVPALQHRVLGGRQAAAPFGVAAGDFERGGGRRGERAADERTAASRRQRRERGEAGGAGEQQMSAGGHDGLLEAGS